MTQNQKAFLDMIAWSEGTIVPKSDNGYNVLVGGTFFHSYADHPRQRIWIRRIRNWSTAAGRYQILERNFDFYKRQLDLPDFSPESQDAIALEFVKECDALADVAAGNIELAIHKCAHIWASLPGNDYQQHQNSLESLKTAYTNAGGTLA